MLTLSRDSSPGGQTDPSCASVWWRYLIRRWRRFWSAPVTVFLGNVIMYFAFLCLFTYVLLLDFRPPPPFGPGAPEIMLYFWVFTLVLEEIRQVTVASGGAVALPLASCLALSLARGLDSHIWAGGLSVATVTRSLRFEGFLATSCGTDPAELCSLGLEMTGSLSRAGRCHSRLWSGTEPGSTPAPSEERPRGACRCHGARFLPHRRPPASIRCRLLLVQQFTS